MEAGEILVYDIRKGRSEAFAADSRVRTADTLQQAWQWSPEIVLIASPTDQHVPMAMEALEHDCHVFIEKPLSHSMEGVKRLCAESERRGLVTMVACNMRFHPGPATIKRLTKEKAAGDVIFSRIQTGSYLPGWRQGQDYRKSYSSSPFFGGAVLDCIHEIDLALWYSGPAGVIASACLPAKPIGLETDGLAEILLQHESGSLSSVHLNFIQRDYRRTSQIICSEGTIYWDFEDRCVRVYGPDGRLRDTCREPQGWQINQMYIDEMAHFLHAVNSCEQTVNPISGGAASLEVALAVRQACGKGERP